MEYEFHHNRSTGQLDAVFSMGQEIVGVWLTEELSDSLEKYQTICQVIDQLQSNKIKQWGLIGHSLSIELDGEQARIYANELDSEDELDELEEMMSFYDGESETFCGLEDFYIVIQQWREFVESRQ
jgi:uncharacterized protein YacL (UPF0231 family)